MVGTAGGGVLIFLVKRVIVLGGVSEFTVNTRVLNIGLIMPQCSPNQLCVLHHFQLVG